MKNIYHTRITKAATAVAACLIGLAVAVPALPVSAADYSFGSGGGNFGKPTSNDNPVSPDLLNENTRRNKDAAYTPPPYGFFSGEFPTDYSSLYHDNTPGGAYGGYASAGEYTGGVYSGSASTVGGTSGAGAAMPGASLVTVSSEGFQSPTSTLVANTAPKYYADGSIGTLYVERTGKTIKVYEGEQLDNLKKGAGHFTSTSAWDGNVSLCGHNRGSWPYFGFVKDLRIGDRLKYTTPYGTRTYEVYSKEQISETDHTKLAWSADNLLTLVTCVIDTPELRWAAQAREVK